MPLASKESILLAMKTITTYNFDHKKVLLRADLNVPIANGTITDDFRLQAILPTIQLIIKNNGIPLIATHIGRPHGFDEKLSTRILIPWFMQHGYQVLFAPTLTQIPHTIPDNTVVLLENMRFNPGEKNHDPHFAAELAATAPYYVNDAFALLHRDDTSITDVPKLYDASHRFIGPLIEKELAHLDRLKKNAQKPFMAILGGGKVKTKLPLINGLMTKTDAIFLCPAIVFTFLKVLKKPCGLSLVDEDAASKVAESIALAKAQHRELFIPNDYLIAMHSAEGELVLSDAAAFPPDGVGISIGPKTIHSFISQLLSAKTIFINASMGFSKRPETKRYTYKLLQEIARLPAYKVAGGGNTIEDIYAAGVAQGFNWLSTGGGATLAYLADEPLPGLEALKN